MPVLESTDEITPRSVLRHRPIGDKTAKTGKESVIPSTSTTPVAQRASRLRPKNTDVAEIAARGAVPLAVMVGSLPDH